MGVNATNDVVFCELFFFSIKSVIESIYTDSHIIAQNIEGSLYAYLFLGIYRYTQSIKPNKPTKRFLSKIISDRDLAETYKTVWLLLKGSGYCLVYVKYKIYVLVRAIKEVLGTTESSYTPPSLFPLLVNCFTYFLFRIWISNVERETYF